MQKLIDAILDYESRHGPEKTRPRITASATLSRDVSESRSKTDAPNDITYNCFSLEQP